MAKSGREKAQVDVLLADIAARRFSPIYFFYGEESFLIDECVQEIVTTALDPSLREFNYDLLQGTETSGKQILSIATSFPMMGDHRLLIVKDFDKVPEKDLIEGYLAQPLTSTILVLTASNPDLRKKPFPLLKKSSKGGEFPKLYDNQIPIWIAQRTRKMGYDIDPEAAAVLHAYVGNSLREIVNALEKLVLFITGKKKIQRSDVEAVIGVTKEFTSYELTNMVGEKNTAKAVQIAEALLSAGESPILLIASLTNYFIKVWKIADGMRLRHSEQELASAAGIHPFFLKQYTVSVRKYSLQEIENAFLRLADADRSMKLSQSDPRTIMISTVTAVINNIPVQQSLNAI